MTRRSDLLNYIRSFKELLNAWMISTTMLEQMVDIHFFNAITLGIFLVNFMMVLKSFASLFFIQLILLFLAFLANKLVVDNFGILKLPYCKTWTSMYHLFSTYMTVIKA